MTKQPSPRLDALRAMRERMARDLNELQRVLDDKTREAVAKADAAFIRRKAKKAKRKASHRGNPA